jgi:RNA polymerase sigma factor (sigma-70 family)
MSNFPSSIWTTILSIKSNPEQVRDLVVRRYRQPVYDFIRRQGLSHEDAEDVTQEVFTQVCREGFLEKANRRKGRFRTLLLAVTRHLVATFRRHELAGVDVAEEHADDADFDDLWVKNLVTIGLERLKSDAAVSALRLQLEGRSYQEIAAALKKSATDVTNYIHRGKKKLRQEIERQIREYSGGDHVEQEVSSLLRFLK